MRTTCCTFFIVLFCYSIDYVFPSTSPHTQDRRSSTGNSFTSTDRATTEWLPEALKDIAYYLRAHKFNEYDRRYETNPTLARREYYKEFPRPPLRSLHWEVHKFCEESLMECVNYLRKRIRNAGLKRNDDTAVVIQEQQWSLNNNSKQIEIVDKECKKMRELDDIQADPFEGPLERFQWRVTASYYLCWYTMKSEPAMAHLSDRCDNFANCLDPDFGPNNEDFRADDTIPFACALYSFCPDPCCPLKHLTEPEKCWNSEDNPCFEANPAGQRECRRRKHENTDFRDIILNRWNVSCSCPRKGFEWSSFYGICIDIDECALGTHTCDSEHQVCLNLPGSYTCACRWDHTFNKKSEQCVFNEALRHLIVQDAAEEDEEEKKDVTLWDKFLNFIGEGNSSERVSPGSKLIIVLCTLLYVRL